MKHNPHYIRQEMNRIAGLDIENGPLKILRDRLLLAYTCFLEPLSYLYRPMDNAEGRLLITMRPYDKGYDRVLPMHPCMTALLEEYGGSIPEIDRKSADALMAELVPHWSVKYVNFNAPTLAFGVMAVEGLEDEEMDLILGVNRLNEVDLEAFHQHKFFEHLRIRMKMETTGHTS
jgi:hypothetical protein